METTAAAAATSAAIGAAATDHQYRPSLRLCEVQRPAKGSCGFHLSRTQWDPYPWVSGVDAGSAAEAAGLLAGDCVLEVNGEDVLGERIGAVAARVRARADKVSLLLWNAGSDPHVANAVSSEQQLVEQASDQHLAEGRVGGGGGGGGGDSGVAGGDGGGDGGGAEASKETLTFAIAAPPPRLSPIAPGYGRGEVCGSGPTPLSLQRLSSCLQAALQLLECPVCLEPAAPRAVQCANGHLLCGGCRARTDRCPVCRVALGPRGRCLLADQLQALLAAACQPAPRSAAAAAAARRKDSSSAAATAAAVSASALQQPLVQLKSRLILPSKSSSVEDICSRKQGSTQTEGGDAPAAGSEAATTAPTGADADSAGSPPRTRSLSTGQLPSGSPPPVTTPDPASTPTPAAVTAPDAPKEPAAPEALVHCPRGADCPGTHPASRIMQHLREAHEGPLVQYFLGSGSSGGALTVRAPAPGAPETVALTTAGGGTLFVCCAPSPRGRLVWLWALDEAAAADAATALAGHGLLLKAADGAEPRPAPVFPLSAPWEEVLASDRCLRVQDAPLVELEVVDKLASSATNAARAVSAVG